MTTNFPLVKHKFGGPGLPLCGFGVFIRTHVVAAQDRNGLLEILTNYVDLSIPLGFLGLSDIPTVQRVT